MNGRGAKNPPRQRGRGKAPQNRTSRPPRSRSIERAQPLAYGQSVGPSPPRGMAYRRGRQVNTQPEIILQVVASTSDAYITVPIISELLFNPSSNPGYGGRAQYMAGLSKLHSEHVWKRLRFTWIPSCATVTPGNVVLKFFPNYRTPLPSQMVDLMDTSSLTFCPYEKHTFTVAGPIGGLKYNIGPTSFLGLSDEDKGDYSIGRLVVGTTAQVSAVPLGIIQMVPEIEFMGPVTLFNADTVAAAVKAVAPPPKEVAPAT
nr:putative coat protein [Cocksfoot mild mosaic virus]